MADTERTELIVDHTVDVSNSRNGWRRRLRWPEMLDKRVLAAAAVVSSCPHLTDGCFRGTFQEPERMLSKTPLIPIFGCRWRPSGLLPSTLSTSACQRQR
jgi:hypothetical protein